jgi:hypothetical protein
MRHVTTDITSGTGGYDYFLNIIDTKESIQPIIAFNMETG